MLRWFMQIAAMLGDLAIALACMVALIVAPFWLSIPLVYMTYKTWKSTDGAVAWTKEGRENFLRNAKELGL